MKFNNRSAKTFSMFLVFTLVFTTVFGAFGAMPAHAATTYYNISSLPVAIKAYPTSTGNNTAAYNSTAGGAKSGTIYAADLCTINSFSGNEWMRVTYPVSGGKTRTLYVPRGSFFCSNTYRKASITRYANAYRRYSGSATIGSVGTSDTLVYVVGSASNGRYQTVYKVTGTNYYKVGWVETGAVRFASTYYEPKGCFDGVSSDSANKISVSGWAYDGDNTGKQIDIHVYVGGPAGSGYGVNIGAANTYRPDVHKVFSCGNYHGFSKSFSVPAQYGGTTQTVYVYAINIGGGSNQLIGTKSVYIKASASGGFISEAKLQSAASSYGISTGSNAYAALRLINTKYASKLTSSQKSGTLVFMFEGVGGSSSTSKRENAMCVVVRNGSIVYINRYSSTIPDYPFNPAKNGGDPMPTIKSGIYSFSTVNHRGSYAALNVNSAQVVRFRSKTSWYDSTSAAINIHRKSSDSIASASAGWVNSAGCQLVGRTGTGSSSEYARFIQAVGIVNSGDAATCKYRRSVSGKYIVDRTYAAGYMRNIGYSDSAIKAIG